MEPVIKALEEEYSTEDIVFITANVDEEGGSALAGDYNVRFLPTFIYIDRSGEVVGQDVGGQSRSHLEEQIEQLL